MNNPTYAGVVQPLLSESKGDPTELLRQYPDFNPTGLIPDRSWYYYYMHHACYLNHLHVVKGLISCGASLLGMGQKSITPLRLASGGSDPERAELVEWILEQPDGSITINQKDMAGWTALHYAAHHGNVAVIRVLLKHGADPTILNNFDKKPYQYLRKHSKVLGELESYERLWNSEEWRPWNHSKFPLPYREAMSTLVVLARSL